MLSLTTEQRVKVEENMGLVGKVIGDCVHTLDKGCIYTYDDLFQIGCIGLCKAAQTDRSGHENAFSTYAYCLIRNEIYTQLEYATRRGREQATDPAELPCGVVDDSLEERDACRELMGCWTGLKLRPPAPRRKASGPSGCALTDTPVRRLANCLAPRLTM